MHEVTMPKLSDSMEIGKIVTWRVSEGDVVKEGDTLADVESDKATMELEAFHSGTVAKIVHGDGDEVPIGEVIAFIGDPSEGAPPAAEVAAEAAPESTPEPAAEAAAVERPAEPEPSQPARPAEAAPVPAPQMEASPAAKPVAPPPQSGERPIITPYAMKLARELSVDATKVAGSGPGGRVIAKDVQAAAKSGSAAAPVSKKAAPASAAAAPAKRSKAAVVNADPMALSVAKKYDVDVADLQGTGTNGRVTVEDVMAARPPECCVATPPSPDEELPAIDVTPEEADVTEAPFRLKTQARRVTASKHVIPHYYLTRSVDVTGLLDRKAELKSAHGASITHAVMWACLQTLKKHPDVNRSYDRGKIVTWKHVNLGLAVATDQGLTVAVLASAEDLSLKEIAARSADLVERARAGKLKPDERKHATFTITNLGMFGIEEFMPVINPPSSVTLGVAAALEKPIVKNDAVEVGRVMKLTMSCDHRILEGAPASAFFRDLQKLLERPQEIVG